MELTSKPISLTFSCAGPAFGEEEFQFRLVMAKDAVIRINGSSPFPESFSEECLYPNVFDPLLVRDSIVICNFSASFRVSSSSIVSLVSTAKVLGFKAFVLAANSAYGDYVAPPIPFSIAGLMISKVSDVQVSDAYLLLLGKICDGWLMSKLGDLCY